jgi:hypothetical protein
VRRLAEAFDGVDPRGAEEWEDYFRRYDYMHSLIGEWRGAADVFRCFARPTDRPEVRRDIFQVVMACMNGNRRYVRYLVSVQNLTGKQVGKIIDAWFGPEVRPDATFDVTFGPELLTDPATVRALDDVPVYPLDALERPGFRAVIRSADVVFGFCDATGLPGLFYGREAFERIVRTGRRERLKVVAVRCDSRTSQVEFLKVAVADLKGSCCDQAVARGAN